MTDPKHTHLMDQGLAAMTDLAKVARHFYCALRDEGFDHDDALALTMNWMDSIRPTQ